MIPAASAEANDGYVDFVAGCEWGCDGLLPAGGDGGGRGKGEKRASGVLG